MKINSRHIEMKFASRDCSVYSIVAVHYNPNGQVDFYPLHFFNSEAVARCVITSVEREYLDREDSDQYSVMLMQKII